MIIRKNPLTTAVFVLLLLAPRGWAVTIFDINPDLVQPTLPTVIDNINSSVYITNTTTENLAGAGSVDTLQVGAYGQLHLGYAYGYDDSSDTTQASVAGAAQGSVDLGVDNDMRVEGSVHLGKDATSNIVGLPNAATTNAISLTVGDTLEVVTGGSVVVNGYTDAYYDSEGVDRHSVVTAGRALVNGGQITLQDHASLITTSDTPSTNPTGEAWHSLVVSNGGRLTLNGGLPTAADIAGATLEDTTSETATRPNYETWSFKGVDVSAGGDGILVSKGGVLAAGTSGGMVYGTSSQSVHIATGGVLDAGAGNLEVVGMDVNLDGSYRAGYTTASGATTRLIVDGGNLIVGKDAAIGMTRDLQRHINTSGTDALANAVLLESDSITFATDASTQVQTGMGLYSLEIDSTTADTTDYLRVGTVQNAVTGNLTESDRETFRKNMATLWRPGKMNRDQSDNIYNLTAVENPTVIAYGAGGELNKSVLEAFVDGKNQAVGSSGVADESLFQMYNAGAQWGVNTVAYNTATEFIAGLNQRVDRIGAELDRLGEGWDIDYGTSGNAFASATCPPDDPEGRRGRFWGGGFGRDEEAKEDYGISGYRYKPRGVMLGYDQSYGNISLGAAAAYGSGDYEDKASSSNKSTIRNYSAGIYGAWHSYTGLNLSGYATYSHLDNKISDLRGGMARKADFSSYSWSAGARVGYDMYLTDRLSLSPSVGLQRVEAVGRAHDEYLDGTSVMRIGDVKRDSVLVPLDLTVGYDILKTPGAILRLTGTLGYAYDFDDGGLDGDFMYEGLAGSTSMKTAQREAGRNRYTLGAGLLYTGRRFDLGARYDFYKRSEQTTHQAKGSVGLKF